MISRRIIRIKVLQVLYSHYKTNRPADESEKELMFSIRKTYDLFFYLIQLVVDVRDYSAAKIDLNRQKKVPTPSDLSPNTRFADNKVIRQLQANKQVNRYMHNNRISWVNNPEIIREVFTELEKQEFYRTYMNKEKCSYDDDKQLVMNIFNNLLNDFEPLNQTLEEQSIFWNTECSFIALQAAKAIKTLTPTTTEDFSLTHTEPGEEDLYFIRTLFRHTINNESNYRKLIEEYSKNWEIERIAFMDILLMLMAVSEVIAFPTIPSKVSLNEYIEIAKSFSTQNSAQFINGVLDKIVLK